MAAWEPSEMLEQLLSLGQSPDVAQKLLVEAEDRLLDLKARERQLRTFIEFVGTLADGAAADAVGPDADEPMRRVSIREAILHMLGEKNLTVHVDDLIPLVEERRGGPLASTHKKNTIHAVVSQSDELRSRDGRIGLSEWPDGAWDDGPPPTPVDPDDPFGDQ